MPLGGSYLGTTTVLLPTIRPAREINRYHGRTDRGGLGGLTTRICAIPAFQPCFRATVCSSAPWPCAIRTITIRRCISFKAWVNRVALGHISGEERRALI